MRLTPGHRIQLVISLRAAMLTQCANEVRNEHRENRSAARVNAGAAESGENGASGLHPFLSLFAFDWLVIND